MSLKIENIVFVLYFFIPGFISLKFYRILFATDKVDFSKDIYEAIGISCINFALMLFPIIKINNEAFINDYGFLYATSSIFIIFISPLIFTLIYAQIVKSFIFQKHFVSPDKVPWDWLFSKRECYWIIVTLKNGEIIGGRFNLKSKASTYPRPKELYIEDIWKLDKNNKFLYSIPRNEGILITEDNILTIQLKK